MIEFKDLNDRQREVVFSDVKRLMVLAGAGSGKTHTVVCRIVRLLNDGFASPGEILALTFSNKAANEMKRCIISQLNMDASGVFVKTFHKLGSFILRECGSALGLQDFSIYDEHDSVSLLKACYPDHDRRMLKKIASSILEAKDRGYEPGTYMKWKGAREEWLECFVKYEEALKESGCVDFADLIALPCRILNTRPDIRSELQARWRYVFVDEYQDTNGKQFELLRYLVGEDVSLCAVGDDDQSIYAFRGAENRHILDFNVTFSDAQTVKLEQNYRSTKAILALSNSLIRENVNRRDKTLWTDNRQGNKPVLSSYASGLDEEMAVCEKVSRLTDQGTICIIYRNNAQSVGFEKELTRLGLPYCVFKGDSFFQKEEIRDCIAYFSLALNPHDVASFLRILPKPSRGIGDKTLDSLMPEIMRSGDGAVEAMLNSGRLKAGQRAQAERLQDLLSQAYKALESHDVGTFCDRLITDTGLLKMHEEGDNEASGKKGVKRDNIREFLRTIKDSGISDPESLRDYLENISLSSQTDVPDMRKVVLSSMHSVKGLEFDICFVTGLEDDIIPSVRCESEEEERRLLYVAMTRAKKRLYLSYCGKRFRNGALKSAIPSRFITDFDSDKYIFKDKSAKHGI